MLNHLVESNSSNSNNSVKYKYGFLSTHSNNSVYRKYTV